MYRLDPYSTRHPRVACPLRGMPAALGAVIRWEIATLLGVEEAAAGMSIASVRLQFRIRRLYEHAYNEVVVKQYGGKWHKFLTTLECQLCTFFYTIGDLTSFPNMQEIFNPNELRVSFRDKRRSMLVDVRVAALYESLKQRVITFCSSHKDDTKKKLMEDLNDTIYTFPCARSLSKSILKKIVHNGVRKAQLHSFPQEGDTCEDRIENEASAETTLDGSAASSQLSKANTERGSKPLEVVRRGPDCDKLPRDRSVTILG